MIVLVKPKAKLLVPNTTIITPTKTPVAAAAAPAQKVAVLSHGGMKFLKRGAEAQHILKEEEKKAEIRAKLRENEVKRYWIPEGGTGCVTFLDGNLKDGVLDLTYCWEHQVLMNGHRRNWFICTQELEPCPICEAASGGDRSQYVAYLTVIDHSEFKGRDGKTYKDQLRLFAAKKDTVKLLQTYAVKRGGLRGCKFDVVRVGSKSASVGSGFDFTEKYSDAQLKQMYGKAKVNDGKGGEKIVDNSQPINYEQYSEMLYQPAEELRKLGFGSLNGPIGSEKGAHEQEEGEAEGYEV